MFFCLKTYAYFPNARFLMEVFDRIAELQAHLDAALAGGCRIGLTPTMGALHAGHLNLIKRSVSGHSCTVVSIYANPTQFDDPNDLRTYPRQPEKDLDLLSNAGCDVVFFPIDAEMYPGGIASRHYDLGGLDQVVEGYYRPGHFQGVATVVDTLFRLVQPHVAYFGEKDFQQVAVIRRMVEVTGHQVEIATCPTVREAGGLALSSPKSVSQRFPTEHCDHALQSSFLPARQRYRGKPLQRPPQSTRYDCQRTADQPRISRDSEP